MHRPERTLFGHALMYKNLTIRIFLLFWTYLSLTVSGYAQPKFDITPEVRSCYASALALNFESAHRELALLSKNDPDNLMRIYIADYIDFFTLFISEDRSLYHEKKSDQALRLDLLKNGPEESPWFRFTRAEVYLHRALLRIKFEEYLSAAADINRAFKLLKKNEVEFPEFGPTFKSIGLLRMGVGTIPDKYMWAVKLFSSLEGTIESGIENVERSIALGEKSNTLIQRETQYLYAQAMVHFENDPEKAWIYLNSIGLEPETNILECFVLSNLAMRTGRNDLAIELLNAKPTGADSYEMPYLELMLGRAMLFRGDVHADIPFMNYIDSFDTENYIKEAYQKLAWNALLNNDLPEYRNLMDSCLIRGRAILDEDKHALKEAERGVVPNRDLLEIRLLFDGSYHDLALSKLSIINKSDLNRDEILEYEYRKARIFHQMGRFDEATRHYIIAIQLGENSDFYYACNAALQTGIIYEQGGKPDEAGAFFNKCLAMHPVDYQSSLHQKAKAGLSRLKSADKKN